MVDGLSVGWRRVQYRAEAPVFTRRIFFGVVMTWVLLEGSKGLWRLWAMQNKGASGFRGALADDIEQVTG